MPVMTRLSRAEIANAMRKAGWPESAIPMGVAIALAESGGNPNAVNRANRNGSTDYGLFQINTVHGSLLASGSWNNPVDNARMALKVYQDAGSKWTPWSVYNHGTYRRYYQTSNLGDLSITPDPPPGDFGSGVAKGIGDTLGGGAGAAGSLFSLGFLGSNAFWKRFGIGLLGVLLIIIGVVIIFRQPLTDIGKGAANLIPAGRVANLAGAALKGAKK